MDRKYRNGRSRLLVIALILTTAASSLLTGFTWMEGIENVYYSTRTELFDKTYFSRMLAGHGSSGIQRAYTVTADTVNSAIEPIVFTGESSGKYSLDTMVNTLEANGYRVVAGINGDLFSMDTGCPQGLTIHDGRIISSGYQPQFGISFDETGKAELIYPNLNYGLSANIYRPMEDGSYHMETYNANIGYFNVPHGGAQALHLYNRDYGASTKTTGTNTEIILETGSAAGAHVRIGGTIKATVAEIRPATGNTPISDTQLVLSTKQGSESAPWLQMLAAGDPVEIYISDLDNGPLTRSKECIGLYHLLYADGQYKSSGTNVNPRTCIGIMPDGSVMLYVVDGRQPGISGGLGLTDVAKHMVSLGCVVVGNLDGGGSTAMVVREPGLENKAVLKNRPSGGSQRNVTNGLFFAYRNVADDGSTRLSTYPESYLAMPGADVKLNTYATNSLFEFGGHLGSLSYQVIEGQGSVSADGVLTPTGEGRTVVEISNGSAKTTAHVETTKDITFQASVNSVVLDPGGVIDINMTARHGYAPITGKDSLYTWTCDPHVGTIDQNGVFTGVNRTGASGNIVVSYNGQTLTIPVQVGQKITFSDIQQHWAQIYIESLAGDGVVNGMGDNLFGPDSPLTRAQFLAMLAKSVNGLDVTAAQPAGFADVPVEEWYYHYINWGYENGIVKGMDATYFAPNSQITREQMAVMLNSFAAVTGIMLPDTGAGMTFSDNVRISDWAVEAVTGVVAAGIINGQPDGTFQPQGSATRAQAAKVIWMTCEIRNFGS